jgi:hypothetical protein
MALVVVELLVVVVERPNAASMVFREDPMSWKTLSELLTLESPEMAVKVPERDVGTVVAPLLVTADGAIAATVVMFEGAVTVTAHVAVLLPSAVVTVMVAVPPPTAVTMPPLTVATALLLVDQVTFVLVALVGAIVGVRVPVAVPPTTKFRVVRLRLTAVTDTLLVPTVTAHVAVLLPSSVVTVMVAVPVATGVTMPPLTVATALLLVDQVTFVLVALVGETVAVRLPVAPFATRFKVVGERLTLVTETGVALTYTVHVAVLLPSAVVTVTVAVPAATGVTIPPLTVATALLLVDQATVVLEALVGAMVAVRVPVAPPIARYRVD